MIFWNSFVLSFTALLPLINPIGSALVFLGLVGEAAPATYRKLARNIAINTVIFLAVIELLGGAILNFFGISLPIVQLAGGLVVAGIGWGLLNQQDVQSVSEDQKTETQGRLSPQTRLAIKAAAESAAVPDADHDPYAESLALKTFYPFTFPITAGPGTLVVMLTLSAHASNPIWTERISGYLGVFAAVVVLCAAVYPCYAYAPALTRKVSQGTVHGTLRVIAFIVLCIGAQIAWNGLSALIPALHHS